MDGKSLDLTAEKIQQLKTLFPEVFSENKLDFQRLRQALGEDVVVQGEHYELSWAGKSEARKEIQKPTTATLIPKPEESINFNTTQNIFIEGENLEVLRVLQKSYFGKVKMIYIDPPYNTGNDFFIYPDDYSERLSDYQQRAGQLDENGFLNKQDLWRKNTKENGQFHSVWLSMMYPRLYLARNLLREDGVIFISIDENEASNLKLMCDEIFGEENFVTKIIRKTKSTTNDAKLGVNIQHEYVICFAKNVSLLKFKGDEKTYESYSNPDNDEKGEWTASDPTATDDGRKNKNIMEIVNPFTGKIDTPGIGRRWRFNEEGFYKLVQAKRIIFKNTHKPNERGFILKRYKNELQDEFNLVPTLLIDNDFMNQAATKETYNLFEAKVFDYPKPTNFIKKLTQYSTSINDIILDFFAGSCTTAQAVIELNEEDSCDRKFICVQDYIAEKLSEESEAYKAGYKTIADISKARIKKVIEKTQQKVEQVKKDLADTQTSVKEAQTKLNVLIKQAQLDLEGKPVLSKEGQKLQKEIEKGQTQINELEAKILIYNDLDLGFTCYILAESNFQSWRTEVKGEEIIKQLDVFQQPEKPQSNPESMLTELLLKAGLGLNLVYTQENSFYKVGAFWVCFEPYMPEMKEIIVQAKPHKVVFLNSCFTQDADLTNLALELKENDIALITI